MKHERYLVKLKLKPKEQARDLAKEYGEPLWCVGTGMRNSHLRAVAPTVSNSKLSGNVSPGIEPDGQQMYLLSKLLKVHLLERIKSLEAILNHLGKNTKEVWDQMLIDGGSVQGIECLKNYYVHIGESFNSKDGWGKPTHKDEVSKAPEKIQSDFIQVLDIFKTFKEINQLELVKQAGVRQQYVDQSVSLNLAFPKEASPKFINQVHLEAYDQGIKTLYYMRTESVLRGDIATMATDPDCLSCDG